jgi:hypothetical protein
MSEQSIRDSAPAAGSGIVLHIDELLLHGFPSGAARGEIGAAVERELARLLAEHGLPPALERGHTLGRLNGGSFEVAPNSSPEAIGAQIAQAVYHALTPAQRSSP